MTIQQKRIYRNLIDAILTIARDTVHQRGRRLGDLRYAKRPALPRDAFYFKKHIAEDIWEMLQEIVQKAKVAFPEYELSVVAEISSELFNSTDDEWEKFQVSF